VREAIRQPINQASRQSNPEITANDGRIIHDVPDLIQTLRWQLSIDMDKPKDLPACGARAGIHLPPATAIALDKLITKSSSEPICAIGASAVCNDDLRFRRSFAQMLKEGSYQRHLVEYRNNDRNLHSSRFTKLSLGGESSVRLAHSKILDLSGIKPFGHASCKQAE